MKRIRLLAALLALGSPLGAEDETARPPLTVFFADGTSQPLGNWTLSYEYATWPKGEPSSRGTMAQHRSPDLLLGKRVVPTAGALLELTYVGATARGLVVVDKDGKRSTHKLDPPPPEVLVPGLRKDVVVQARGLDLYGETLTGGKRSYCLLGYTALVQCAAEVGQRVVKIQFP
jgi:hypothetical protein